MGKKILTVLGISAAIVVSILIMTMFMPTIKTMSDYAYNATANKTTAGNYTYYLAAQKSAPLWLYGLPLLIGGVGIWIVLKRNTEA